MHLKLNHNWHKAESEIILRSLIHYSCSNFDLQYFIFELLLSFSNNSFFRNYCHVQNLRISRSRFTGCLTVMEWTCREHWEPVKMTGDLGRRLQWSAGRTRLEISQLSLPFLTLNYLIFHYIISGLCAFTVSICLCYKHCEMMMTRI